MTLLTVKWNEVFKCCHTRRYKEGNSKGPGWWGWGVALQRLKNSEEPWEGQAEKEDNRTSYFYRRDHI